MGEVKTETADTLRGFSQGEPSVMEGLLGVQRENLEDWGWIHGRMHWSRSPP